MALDWTINKFPRSLRLERSGTGQQIATQTEMDRRPGQEGGWLRKWVSNQWQCAVDTTS